MILEALTSAAIALSPAADTSTNWYGWDWDHPVSVYDGTGNPNWDVAGAVKVWSVHGLDLYMTDDPNADIVVTQGTPTCTEVWPIVGCSGAEVANGEPVKGRIVMSEQFADWPTEYLLRGTAHEFCHVIGFTHPEGLTNEESLCAVPITLNGGIEVRLTTYDKRQMRLAY